MKCSYNAEVYRRLKDSLYFEPFFFRPRRTLFVVDCLVVFWNQIKIFCLKIVIPDSWEKCLRRLCEILHIFSELKF